MQTLLSLAWEHRAEGGLAGHRELVVGPIIVRVASWDAAPKGIPVLPAPAQGAAPRANITAILKEGRVHAVAHVESFHEKAQVVERALARISA